MRSVPGKGGADCGRNGWFVPHHDKKTRSPKREIRTECKAARTKSQKTNKFQIIIVRRKFLKVK